MNKDVFIIECSACSAKNRVKAYQPEQIPVCAKCKEPLVDGDENEAHANFSQKLKDFYNLPDINSRPGE